MIHQKTLAVFLILILGLVIGTMHQNYASHLVQHTHHSPVTHSTGICSWMCAAAQTISGDAQVMSHHFQPVAFIEWALPELTPHISSLFLPTRAPPR